jgi:hypothetical protein
MDKKCTYVWNAHKWKKWIVIDMYTSCDVSLLPNPLQNAQQHQHLRTCKKKNHLFIDFNYLLPPMHETKILKPLQINGNYPFSQQYLQNNQKNKFNL